MTIHNPKTPEELTLLNRYRAGKGQFGSRPAPQSTVRLAPVLSDNTGAPGPPEEPSSRQQLALSDLRARQGLRQGGYLGQSRSVRSAGAIEDGRVPMSHVAAAHLREHGIEQPLVLVKWLASKGHLESTEWHHTGKGFAKTDHWNLDEVKEQLDELGPDRLTALDRERIDEAAAKKSDEGYPALITYTEFSGGFKSRNAKAIEKVNVECVVRDGKAYFADGKFKRLDSRSVKKVVRL